jgi:hypothetical protein
MFSITNTAIHRDIAVWQVHKKKKGIIYQVHVIRYNKLRYFFPALPKNQGQ